MRAPADNPILDRIRTKDAQHLALLQQLMCAKSRAKVLDGAADFAPAVGTLRFGVDEDLCWGLVEDGKERGKD